MAAQPVAFVPRADDIILATQPKCGTTWLKALAFTITNRSRYGFIDHPLLTHHPQHLVPFIQIPCAGTGHTNIDPFGFPRLLATHTPMSLLPPGMRSLGCRVVYLCRDPKDALVSRLHFENKAFPGTDLSMDRCFSMFCKGFSPYGPFWDHCLEYWRESMARPDSVLFLKYEEIKSDPTQVVRKLAKFLGVPLTEEEERSGVAQEVVRLCSFEALTSLQVNQVPPTEEEESSGVAQEVVRLCSFETLTSLQVNQVGGVRHGDSASIGSSAYYRKGEVGDWANHMSHEMADKLDRIVQQKLDGSGLVF
ncbi:Sulfotransferase 16 [Triticum urartu]|uniref:Sulfotransferase n=1 Tax=Triticum urartu TaxID=4572 RepID=M7ZUK5_TRIUA|nr:Sulfotransferase 16 [Triticum urartu]